MREVVFFQQKELTLKSPSFILGQTCEKHVKTERRGEIA
jgi:hypothetical protein